MPLALSRKVTSAFSGATDELPNGECFPWTNQKSIYVLDSQSEVDRLVLLQLHIDITQSSADERIVATDDHWQRFLCTHFGKMNTLQRILQMPFQDFSIERR